jgi:hypothetical protein
MTLDVFTRWWVLQEFGQEHLIPTGTQIFHNNTVYVSRKTQVKATNAGISFSGSQLAGVQLK